LLATAITLDMPAYDRARLCRIGTRVGLGDSKQTSGFGAMAHAESVALALVEQASGQCPTDVDTLLHSVSLDTWSVLRAPCPAATAEQCWSANVSLPAFGGDITQGRHALARLARHGVRVARARSVVACAGVLNRERARLGSRSQVDLAMFERLVMDTRAAAGAELDAVLGFVGGIRDYPRYFQHLPQADVEALPRKRGVCAYRVPGVGTLSFEVDADARHLPVALASMLGKYLRELLMERQNRYYLGHDASLPRPSGYHDPVTQRFVAQSEPLRRRLGIVDGCFER
jgi:hypothetical protein